METTEFVNKVANSGLITIDLAELVHPGERIVYDIKDNLFHGLMLKEKDFRAFIKEHDWSQYSGKNVAIICSTDAIVPTWAYMLLQIKLEPYANLAIYGDLKALEQALFQQALSRMDLEEYRDGKIVIKGCGSELVTEFAYVELTRLLRPIVQSLMYGEPCSTVPLYKRSLKV
jgi:hypothetical protein